MEWCGAIASCGQAKLERTGKSLQWIFRNAAEKWHPATKGSEDGANALKHKHEQKQLSTNTHTHAVLS